MKKTLLPTPWRCLCCIADSLPDSPHGVEGADLEPQSGFSRFFRVFQPKRVRRGSHESPKSKRRTLSRLNRRKAREVGSKHDIDDAARSDGLSPARTSPELTAVASSPELTTRHAPECTGSEPKAAVLQLPMQSANGPRLANDPFAELSESIRELEHAQESLLRQFYDKLGMDASDFPRYRLHGPTVIEQLSAIHYYQTDFFRLVDQMHRDIAAAEASIASPSDRNGRGEDNTDEMPTGDPYPIHVPHSVASLEPEDTLLFQMDQELRRVAQQEVSFVVPPDCVPGTDVSFTHNGSTYRVTIGADHLVGSQVHVRVGKPPPLSPQARKEVHDFVRVAGEAMQVNTDPSISGDMLHNVTSQKRLHAYRSLQGQSMRPLLPDIEEDEFSSPGRSEPATQPSSPNTTSCASVLSDSFLETNRDSRGHGSLPSMGIREEKSPKPLRCSIPAIARIPTPYQNLRADVSQLHRSASSSPLTDTSPWKESACGESPVSDPKSALRTDDEQCSCESRHNESVSPRRNIFQLSPSTRTYGASGLSCDDWHSCDEEPREDATFAPVVSRR